MIRALPRDLCPESKVTSALADKKDLGLHPIVIGVDECQVWFEHPEHAGFVANRWDAEVADFLEIDSVAR